MGIWLESDAFAALCHLELKEKVSCRRMWGMNRGIDLPKRRSFSLRRKCTLAMLMNGKAEVNQPLSTASLIL